jgi:cytochrome P450
VKLDPLTDYSSRDAAPDLAEAAAGPRVWQDPNTNAYYVTHYEDVAGLLDSAALTTRRLSENQTSMAADAHGVRDKMRARFARWPLFSDGEYHDRLRERLSGVFKDGEDEAGRRAAALLARVLPRDGAAFDWLGTVAEPLAAEVLALLLGVGSEEARTVASFGVPVVDSLAMPLKDKEGMGLAVAGMDALAQWLAARLGAGAADTPFLDALAAVAADPALGPEAAAGALAQVVTGAFDPLASAATMLALVATPQALGTLSERALVEEALRLATPFRFARRFTREPVEVAGVRIPGRALVLLCLGSANLDAGRFPCPLRPAEGRPGHAAFSRGRHYCPGAELVRGALAATARTLAASRSAFVTTQVHYARELNILRYARAEGALVPF